MIGRSPTNLRLMPAMILLQAISASILYLSWAGYVPPLHTKISVEPLLGDALELAEEMKFGVFAWVTPPVQDKMRCQLIQNLRRSNVAGMNEIEI